MRLAALLCAVSAVVWPFASFAAGKQGDTPHDRGLAILEASVAYRTTRNADVEAYAHYIGGLLTAAGFAQRDVRIEPLSGVPTLIATYPGGNRQRKPILILGHMDVVEAKREDWQRDPFTASTDGGYLYGRGVLDNKFDISMVLATLIQLKREGWKPARDVILLLSGDEETDGLSSRELAQRFKGAELALNTDAGGGILDDESSAPIAFAVQAAEKTYLNLRLTVTDKGGHASRPTGTNAIYRLAHALQRLEAHVFPVVSNELTRSYFTASAQLTKGPAGEAMKRYLADPGDAAAIATLSADPRYLAQLRTTCVATQVDAGHASNALPQRAVANVNCRVFPGTTVAGVIATLHQVVADPTVDIASTMDEIIEAPVSPLRADVLAAVKKAVAAEHPKVTIMPTMDAGATDSTWFRAAGVPSYGVSGLFIKGADFMAHGLDERVPLASIDGALAYWNVLIREIAK